MKINRLWEKTLLPLRLWCQKKIWLKHRAPNLLFPVCNEETGSVVWFETNVTAYGLFVTIHQQKPHLKSIKNYSWHTAMAGIHTNFFTSNQPGEDTIEQIKLQLYDASVGPYDDAHWVIPNDYDCYSEASILLVSDV